MDKTLFVTDPRILQGKPVVKGTRIAVDLVLEELSHNPDINELLAAHPCGAQKCCRVTAFSRRASSCCKPPQWSKDRALLCAQRRELYEAGSDWGSRYGACSRRKPAINRKWRRLLVTRVWSPSRAIAAINASGIPRPWASP